MNKQSTLLLLLSIALLGAGCASTGGQGDVLPSAQLGQAKVIVLDLPYTVSTVKRELWEQAMVGFGLESAMIERLSQRTQLMMLSGSLADDAFNEARGAQARQIRDFSQAVKDSPRVTDKFAEAVRTQLAAHPMAIDVDYVIAGWISRFSVDATTSSFAGPLSGQNRDCVVRAEVAVYDVKSGVLYRNSGDSKWKITAMGMVVSPTRVITELDLSAASRASHAAVGKALDRLLGLEGSN
jgi:hypothetical protein